MILNKKTAALMTLTAALSMSCKKDNEDKTTDTGKKLEVTPGELVGTWKSGCVANSVLDLSHTQREYVLNRIGDFDKIERYYSDDACQKLMATYKVVGTAETKGKMPDQQDVEMINFTVNDARFTVNSDDAAKAFNTLKLCDKADWKVGEEVPVVNSDCLGYKIRKGDVIFESYDVRDGQLYFGEKLLFLAKDSGENRPTKLDMDVPYAKQ